VKTVLVTGAAGFLGSHLAEHYLNKGFHVVGVDNLSTSNMNNVDYLKAKFPQYVFHKFDACGDWAHLKNEIKGGLAYVLHFASPASPPLYQKLAFETIDINTNGLLKALNFAQDNGGRVVFASTSEIYGDPAISPQVESYWGNVNSFGPRSCYDEAKRLGETLIFEFNRKHNSHHGLVRIFNTYGPRMNADDGRVVINFLVQAERGESLTIYGTGSQTRSFCYVDDLIAGITKYAESTLTTPVNLGNQNEFTILQLAENVKAMYPEKKLELKFFDLPQDDPKLRRPDTTLAKKHLDWTPQVQLQTGLERMRSWLKESKYL
jgi:Nucleoside-diphosphate-sugar epimerases